MKVKWIGLGFVLCLISFVEAYDGQTLFVSRDEEAGPKRLTFPVEDIRSIDETYIRDRIRRDTASLDDGKEEKKIIPKV